MVRLEAANAAEIAAADDLLQGLKITVLTAILVDGEQAAAFLCESHQLNRFFERVREWFVDNDVTTGFEAPPSERIVRVVRRGNDDATNVPPPPPLFEPAHDAHTRIQ